jgi:hypothetical protein
MFGSLEASAFDKNGDRITTEYEHPGEDVPEK